MCSVTLNGTCASYHDGLVYMKSYIKVAEKTKKRKIFSVIILYSFFLKVYRVLLTAQNFLILFYLHTFLSFLYPERFRIQCDTASSVTWRYTLVLLLHCPQDFFSVPCKKFLFVGFCKISTCRSITY